MWGLNQRKFLQTETKEEEAKTNPKKGRTLPTHASLKGKKLRAVRKKGRKKMREKKKRGIFAHFCFHPNLVISSSSNSREGARQKRDAVVHLFAHNCHSKNHFLIHQAPLDFSFVFSAPLLAWRYLFSTSGIFRGGRYQPGCTGICWSAEGTSQPVTISKKCKNPSSALLRKRTPLQAVLWFSACSLGLPAWGTDLESQKGLY